MVTLTPPQTPSVEIAAVVPNPSLDAPMPLPTAAVMTDEPDDAEECVPSLALKLSGLEDNAVDLNAPKEMTAMPKKLKEGPGGSRKPQEATGGHYKGRK